MRIPLHQVVFGRSSGWGRPESQTIICAELATGRISLVAEADVGRLSRTGPARRPSPPSRLRRSPCSALRRTERRGVHRDREDHLKKKIGGPGVEKALRLEAEQAAQVTLLEDRLGDPKGERAPAHKRGCRPEATCRNKPPACACTTPESCFRTAISSRTRSREFRRGEACRCSQRAMVRGFVSRIPAKSA